MDAGNVAVREAAVDRFGPEHGPPEPYSPNRSYHYLGTPPERARTAIYLGSDAEALRGRFTTVRRAGTMDNRLDVNNNTQGTPIWVCEVPEHRGRNCGPSCATCDRRPGRTAGHTEQDPDRRHRDE
ncbi:MAG TPA: hypothetical protein VGJ13_21585 [Pseudonocardiaceae bacterium]|jgi:hypothetical protein